MKARKYTLAEIQEKLAFALSPEKPMLQQLEQMGVKELVEELSIYQQELEYQNDELRNAQIALERAKLYAESLFEQAPVAYVVLNEAFGMEKFNTLFKATFQRTNVEIGPGVDFRKLIAPGDQDDFHRFMMGTAEMKHHNGITLKVGERYFHIKAQRTNWHEKSEWRISLTDLHNEQLILAALTRSERRFKNLIQLAPDVIFTLHSDAKTISFVSNRVNAWMGMPATALVGQSITDFIYSEDLEKAKGFIAELVRSEQRNQSYKIDLRVLDARGEPCWIEWLAQWVVEEGIYNPYVLCLAHPIHQLKEQQTILESKNVQLQQFSHIISHNLSAYVSNVHGLIGLMAEPTSTSHERNELLPILQQASNNLKEAVEKLNEMLKIQKNGDLGKVKLRLKDELHKVLMTLEGSFQEAGLRVQLLVDEEITVCFHPAYLQSVLLNMCTNAIRYKRAIPDALLTISAAEASDKTISLVFEDNGQGMDLAVVGHKLFGMFQTFHQHPEAKGLGLFMVKHQLEAMGGEVHVSSKVDIGTKFEMIIPGCLEPLSERVTA